MVFRVLLCNWLIVVLTFGAARLRPCRQEPGQPLRIVVLGDSLVAGFGIKPSDAFPAQLERALKAKGPCRGGHQCRRFGRYHGRRARARGVGRAREHRRGDPGARRQRRAARPRSGARQGQPRRDHHQAQGRRRRGAAGGHDGAAQSGPGLRARLRRHLSRPRHQARADPLPVLPRRRGHGRQAQPRRRPASQRPRRRRDHQEDHCRRSSS